VTTYRIGAAAYWEVGCGKGGVAVMRMRYPIVEWDGTK
jgi:hypothetical protein